MNGKEKGTKLFVSTWANDFATDSAAETWLSVWVSTLSFCSAFCTCGRKTALVYCWGLLAATRIQCLWPSTFCWVRFPFGENICSVHQSNSLSGSKEFIKEKNNYVMSKAPQYTAKTREDLFVDYMLFTSYWKYRFTI